MLLICEVCKKEFDHTNAGECDCGYDCGGASVKCPECGFDVDVPEELKDEIIKFREENSVFTKTERLLEKEGLLDKK
ncbi:hypothetical protein [Methanosphaera sp.]|uniref:hypothetical protein n=1 Tax=Methanosphaera sp. TaxID=2666342 RepID=UPI0026E02EC1|nr:hypothetical protein [Methanosphaera sp.]MDO5822465.1 hypothetical protein [Methanosphaera sp.]